MKKVTALFLAMLMCMALAVPALGAGTGSGDSISSGGSGTVTYTATVQEPTINVTVPSASQNIILNPYQIKVTNAAASGDLATALGTGATDSILATKLILKNQSTVGLKMSLSVIGTPAASVAFSTSEITDTEKNKKVFMFIDVGEVTQGTAPTTAQLSNVTYSSTNTKQAVIKASEVKMTEVATIPAPSGANTENWLPIQIGGQCTKSPTDAWDTNDTITVAIAFSFKAEANTVGSAG